ncbi:hypothetical protein LUZ60_006424 [Juncus effusus]|nr:hypothetical protein LUZ60_006424 [Juncus effusus]
MANRGSDKEKMEQRLDPIPRSRLHNFSFLTSAWGVQRVMRGSRGSRSPVEPSEKAKSPAEEKEKPREVEFEKKKNPLKESPEKRRKEEEEECEKEKSAEINGEAEIPWNLRKRRAYGKGDSGSNGVANGGKEAKKRKPFSVALSYEEIEADFLVMKGKKPPRRPKKRPKHVQRQIDMMFPGMWLAEVTPDLYKVKED